jgi:iron complex outermembrane receptor protein
MKISVGITNLFNKLYRTTSDEDAPFANERRIKLNFDWHKF